ncbi:MAG: SpoIIE family protein phosphatase [Verrucomicrobiota bacterium]
MTDPEEIQTLLHDIANQQLDVDTRKKGETVTLTVEQLHEALYAAFETGSQLQQKDNIESTLLFWQLMESLPDHVFFKDEHSRFTCINHSLARFFGLDHPDEAVGKSDFDMFQPEYAKAKFDAEQEIIHTGKGWTFREERDLQSDGSEKWVLTTKLPLHDLEGQICGTFGLARDITEQKRAEIELERQRKLLDTIVHILPCRIFVRDNKGKFVLINEEYRKVLGLDSCEFAIGKTLVELRDNNRAREVHAEDMEILASGIGHNTRLEFDKRLLGLKKWVLSSKVPLRDPDGKIEGIVGMTLDITEQKEAENRARAANEELKKKNQQFEAELLVARQLQEQLMSMGFSQERLYAKEGDAWKIEASYLYSPSHHLAGDFFYLVPIEGNRLGILVCDVMGHGVKAALVTMLIRGLMLETPGILTQPQKVLKHLNDNLVELAEDEEFPRFVTSVYSVIDLDQGLIRMANAGHPTPLWSAHDDKGDRLDACPVEEIGPALGLISEEKFAQSEFKLSEPTELLFFTDGIIEQKTTSGIDFGVEGLEKSVLSHEMDDLPEQLEALTRTLIKSTETGSFADDICLIAVRVSPNSP